MDSQNTLKLINDARQAYSDEDYSRAGQLYAQAAEASQKAGDSAAHAELLNNCSVCLLKAGKPSEALQAVIGTDEVFAGIGDQRRQAMALGNQAAAFEALKQDEKALDLYQQSAELLTKIGDKELKSYVMQAISTIQLRKGRQLQAITSMESAIENKPHKSLVDRLLNRLIRTIHDLLGR